ncbi:DUF1059 domain-containing protein [Haloferax sp. S1W]|uniref:DUF1059 domain-containing protein n=1 Tax=Haloferax sp. S1W TaxID=3377110 RepID=UPI0037C97EA9
MCGRSPPKTFDVVTFRKRVNDVFVYGLRTSFVMSEEMKQATCSCGFSVVSEDEDELVEIIQNHADAKHGKMMTVDDVRGMMEEA